MRDQALDGDVRSASRGAGGAALANSPRKRLGWVLTVAVGLVAVVLIATLAFQNENPPSQVSQPRQPAGQLRTIDASGDLVLEDGDVPSLDLSMIDVLAMTMRNDGSILTVEIETAAPFPTSFSPYGTGEEDEARIPDISISLVVTAGNGKGVWVSFVSSSLGFSVCVFTGDASTSLCDLRWYEQPVRYRLNGRFVTVTLPLNMDVWDGVPDRVEARLTTEHSQQSPHVRLRDYVPAATERVQYGLWL